MKYITSKIHLFTFILISSLGTTASAADATTELFNLLDAGGCIPTSLTSNSWTITTTSIGTHGELNWGDELIFDQIGPITSVALNANFDVWKNGVLWNSVNGWGGSCVREGTLSVYVVTGEITIDGCLHELAIGRLDHDDRLSSKIEVVFQDSTSKQAEDCAQFNSVSVESGEIETDGFLHELSIDRSATEEADKDPQFNILHPGHAHGVGGGFGGG